MCIILKSVTMHFSGTNGFNVTEKNIQLQGRSKHHTHNHIHTYTHALMSIYVHKNTRAFFSIHVLCLWF